MKNKNERGEAMMTQQELGEKAPSSVSTVISWPLPGAPEQNRRLCEDTTCCWAQHKGKAQGADRKLHMAGSEGLLRLLQAKLLSSL